MIRLICFECSPEEEILIINEMCDVFNIQSESIINIQSRNELTINKEEITYVKIYFREF